VFGKLKKHVQGQRFPSDDTIKANVQKPFLDLCSDGVIRWTSPASEMFSKFAKHESPKGISEGCVMGRVRPKNGFGSRMSTLFSYLPSYNLEC
jgi:hypothetical protein